MNFQVLLLLAFIICYSTSQTVDELGCDTQFTGQKSRQFQLAAQDVYDSSYEIEGTSYAYNGAFLHIIVKSKQGNLLVEINREGEPPSMNTIDEDDDLQFIDIRDKKIFVKMMDQNGTTTAYRFYDVYKDRVIPKRIINSQMLANSESLAGYEPKGIIQYINSNTGGACVDFSTPQKILILLQPGDTQDYFTIRFEQDFSLSSQYKFGNTLILYDEAAGGLFFLEQGATTFTAQNLSDYLSNIYNQINFIKLYYVSGVYLYSLNDDKTSISGIRIYNQKLYTGHNIEYTGSTTPIAVYSDQYSKIIVSTSSEVFAFKTSRSMIQLTKTDLDASQKADVITNFNEALAVTMDQDSFFVLTEDSVSIYPWEEKFAKASIILNDAVTNLIHGDESVLLRFTLKCTCYSKGVSRFICFSGTLECMAVVSNTQRQCTELPDD